MYHRQTSQQYGWLHYIRGIIEEVPGEDAERRDHLGEQIRNESHAAADRFRDKLVTLYGPEWGRAI